MERNRRGIAAYNKTKKKSAPKGAPKADSTSAPELAPAPPRASKAPSNPPSAPSAPAPEGFLKNATEAGVRKAAKFLLLLGKDDAAKILKHLSNEEIEAIGREIANSQKIGKDEAQRLLAEFHDAEHAPFPAHGGPEAARAILEAAFGEEEAARRMKVIRPFGNDRPFGFLNDLDLAQILMLLKKEPPGVLSLLMSHLEPKLAAAVLKTLDPQTRTTVVQRIVSLEKVAPEVVWAIEEKLKENIRAQGTVVTEELDGPGTLSDILKHMSLSDGESILDTLEDVDPDLGAEMRELVYGADVVLNLRDRDLQKILTDYGDQELAVIIKGKDDEVVEKILANVSERRREFIESERERLGPMKKTEVDSATRDFLDYLREMELRGELVIDLEEYI